MKKYSLMLLAIMMAFTVGAQTKNDYNLLVHQKDGKVVTYDAAEVDSISFLEMPAFNTGDDFVIEPAEITSSVLKVNIVPKDKNITYYSCFTDQTGYGRAWDVYGSIFNMDKEWWVYVASLYSKTWTDILPSQVNKGDYTMDGGTDYGFILWDHEYYAYCYGLSLEGEITTPIYMQKYKTLSPTPSENKITVESVTPGEDGKVMVKISTTNDDPYYVGAQKKNYIDSWVKDLGSNEAMFKNLISQQHPTPQYIHKGSQEIELYCATKNADYQVIICGYNGGPTTEIQLVPFRTNP
ncbi:MAG: hypothetical protein MR455_07035 [Prevotella sp.]|nr:hypothetical protein [Prevotella sp.]